MTKVPPGPKALIAFKIGARARKFLLEGCPVEGYEILLTALAESKLGDPALHALLQAELAKFERRLDSAETEEN